LQQLLWEKHPSATSHQTAEAGVGMSNHGFHHGYPY